MRLLCQMYIYAVRLFVPIPDCFCFSLFPAKTFHVLLHLSVYLHITSNFTDAAESAFDGDLCEKSNKQFLALQKRFFKGNA